MSEDRYNRPGHLVEDWHIPLNENFADIGRDVGNLEDRADQLEADVSSIDDALMELQDDFDVLRDEVDDAEYTDTEAREAVDGSDVTVQNTILWNGYELVPPGENPTHEKYIRLEE